MIRILSGAGRYADPWHPFLVTTAGIASVAAELDLDHEAADVTPDTLGDLDGVDVLVVNVGGGGPDPDLSPDRAWSEAFATAEAWLRMGGAMLATHQATNGFPDWPGYRSLLGGEWVPGTSNHPAISDAAFTARPGAEADPLLAGLPGAPQAPRVEAWDERYSHLVMSPEAQVLLEHEIDGQAQPVVWRSGADGVRILVDALGHGPESYESPSRRQLLANELLELSARAN